MGDTTLTKIRDRHQLEMQLLRLQQQTAENDAALRQAKFHLREAKVAQAEYSGSFKRFKDKLTGKKEMTETTLRHAVQKAEADLASAQRQKEVLDARLTEIKQALATTPAWNSLNDGSSEWHRLEVLYCIEVLVPLLEENRELLLERRNQFNGSYSGQIRTHQTLAEIYTAPEAAGEACKPYIQRLKAALDALEIPFASGSYFDNPTFFLSSATQYTRMDRVNEAITQAEQLQRTLPKLKKQLEN